MTVDKKVIYWLASHEALNYSWHKISDNDEVAHADSETFNRNGGIKNNGGIGVCQLR